ncbi:hypothetical protein [Leptolyngbya sp. FACHB-261]|uniref:hypothetical protein n=1 Tax=Leptolyngbya sp. FACHB-261 TaxID=2692806 RepID=UPI0016859389|nr:hypothetical protein [Leptolyngbya sp. FACHB-261]MBD2101785.1 hypothetical protein [Leptolyngbya sp. FACHB-261]
MSAARPSTTVDSLAKGLACSVLEPGLRSILLFDNSLSLFQAAADQLAAMLEGVTGQMPRTIVLGSTETEDSLWGTLGFQQGFQLGVKPGRLVPFQGDARPQLILIPDLARISLPTARACVMHVGADVATLQRHGQNVVWAPDLYWVAGCARGEVGEISPHLLDRFALRLLAPDTHPLNTILGIDDWTIGKSQRHQLLEAPEMDAIYKLLSQATGQLPVLLPETLAYILSHLNHLNKSSSSITRRELALARLSRALACLSRDQVVSTAHVDEAADLIGLRSGISQVVVPKKEASAKKPQKAKKNNQLSEVSSSTGSSEPVDSALEEQVFSADTEEVFPTSPVPADPYPEDTALVSREIDPLQLPPNRYHAIRAIEGPAIGTKRATSLHDIALVSTILEAAKFQKVRSAYISDPCTFQISRADLRSYLRAPIPMQMLVLVIDYTCLHDCDWQEALLPHLSWSYIVRASVSIIQVGAAGAKERLRAEQITARNLLSPRINAALREKGGTATPLAHGLDLAIRTLRTALQHGRNRLQQARLVVISDGRGNVPLEASHAGIITHPVSREGINDALKIARQLRALNNMESFFLNPQPQQHTDLPIMLAETMGAIIQNAALLKLGGS